MKHCKINELLAEYGKIVLKESKLVMLFKNYFGRITEGL